MIKIKYLLVSFVCVLIFPISSNADCTYERQAELSRIASNVNFSYTYEETDKNPVFTVNAINIGDDIYVKDETYSTVSNANEFNFNYDFSGKTLIYNIYSKDQNCYNYKILTKYVTLPKFNNFSKLANCIDYPEFKYCQMWLNTDGLTQDKFDSELKKYAKSTKVIMDDEVAETSMLISFAQKYYKMLIVTVIGIILLPVLIHFKRRMGI